MGHGLLIDAPGDTTRIILGVDVVATPRSASTFSRNAAHETQGQSKHIHRLTTAPTDDSKLTRLGSNRRW